MKMANLLQATYLFCLLLLLHQTEQKVFLSAENANQIIQRPKRANFIRLEEVLNGNLERECLEERCTYEEARETFENKEATDQFWENYYDGKQCSSSPCMNNGVCLDTIRSYTCNCAEGYNGSNCQFANNECHPNVDDGCQQYCHPGYFSYYCSCAHGYQLGMDKKSCYPADPFACGQVFYTEVNSTTKNLHGNQTHTFPWQVLLLTSDGIAFCSGVILNQSSILTTAKCSNMHSTIFIETGDTLDEDSERQIIKVKDKLVHSRYFEETGENNIAVLKLREDFVFNSHCLPICVPQKDFAETILLPRARGTISGWKLPEEEIREQKAFHFQASYIEKNTCESALNITHTTRMFCGAAHQKIGVMLAGGGYFANEHDGVWFLTGIMDSWSPMSNDQNVFSFTKISRYIMWLNQST